MSTPLSKCCYAHSYTQVPIDKNVQAVMNRFYSRMVQGYRKYGTNTERTDLNVSEWLQHLQDELMDACIYVETLKENIKDVP